jgi:hypothetical protein
MGVGAQRHNQAALPHGKRPGTHWKLVGPVWTGAEYLAPTDIRTPDLEPTATPTALSPSTDTLLQDDNIHERMMKSCKDSAPEKVSSGITQNATLRVICTSTVVRTSTASAYGLRNPP